MFIKKGLRAIFVMCCLVFCCDGAYADGVIKTFILAGQSNADGRASTDALPPELVASQPDVEYFFHVDGGGGLSDTLTTLQPGTSMTGNI